MVSVHVIRHRGTWHVAIFGGYEEGRGYRLKRDAVIAGRALARYLHAELVIHNRNGRIAERDSYGNDPERRPG